MQNTKSSYPKTSRKCRTMSRPNLRIIGIEESEDSKLKGPVNIFHKIREENFPKLRKRST
jgi:hypothetical protein